MIGKANQDHSMPEAPRPADNASSSVREAGRQKPVQAMLSPRQAQIAQLITQGLTDKEIGTVLCLTEATVGWHLSQIFLRYGVHSRSALAVRFVQQSLKETHPSFPRYP